MTAIPLGPQGWYLYGIVRGGADVDDPLQLLEFAGLAAVVQPASLDEFTVTALRARMHDAAALEASVRSHNAVIQEIHARQAILPARFGTVYAHADDVVAALRPAYDALLHQLIRLEGCDEWAVHLYADRASVRERIWSRDSAVGRLREAHASARPGRAYFLAQQLRGALETAIGESMSAHARSAFDRLAGHAVAAQPSPIKPPEDPGDEIEILRAAFLVPRDGARCFRDAVRCTSEAGDGLRCDVTGPWPPYTFATGEAGDAL